MVAVIKSASFDRWFANLKDPQARARIAVRLDRLALGNAGDVKPVGAGISELRIDYGPGYRIYFMRRGKKLIVLLCGGDKRTQAADIDLALSIARDWRE
jgi:putative addiction module killer protein